MTDCGHQLNFTLSAPSGTPSAYGACGSRPLGMQHGGDGVPVLGLPPHTAQGKTSAALGPTDLTHHTSRRGMQMNGVSVGTHGLLSSSTAHLQAAYASSIPGPRQISAASTNQAAWKAYGSPSARGQARPPPAPSPAHPKSNAAHFFGTLHGHAPRVMKMGGGFRMARPSSTPAQDKVPQHEQDDASDPYNLYAKHGNATPSYAPTSASQQGLGRPSTAAAGGGGRPSSAATGLRASGEKGSGLQASAGSLRPASAMTVLAPYADALFSGSNTYASNTGEFRFRETAPTDVAGKLLWADQRRRMRVAGGGSQSPRTTSAARPGSARPGSAAGSSSISSNQHTTGAHASAASSMGARTAIPPRPYSANHALTSHTSGSGLGNITELASRERFLSSTISLQGELGLAARVPVVSGFAKLQPEDDPSALPPPSDPRWITCRLGSSQLQRLRNGIKLPSQPRSMSPGAGGGFGFGAANGLGALAKDDEGRSSGEVNPSPKKKLMPKEKAPIRMGARFGGGASDDDEEDEEASGPVLALGRRKGAAFASAKGLESDGHGAVQGDGVGAGQSSNPDGRPGSLDGSRSPVQGQKLGLVTAGSSEPLFEGPNPFTLVSAARLAGVAAVGSSSSIGCSGSRSPSRLEMTSEEASTSSAPHRPGSASKPKANDSLKESVSMAARGHGATRPTSAQARPASALSGSGKPLLDLTELLEEQDSGEHAGAEGMHASFGGNGAGKMAPPEGEGYEEQQARTAAQSEVALAAASATLHAVGNAAEGHDHHVPGAVPGQLQGGVDMQQLLAAIEQHGLVPTSPEHHQGNGTVADALGGLHAPAHAVQNATADAEMDNEELGIAEDVGEGDALNELPVTHGSGSGLPRGSSSSGGPGRSMSARPTGSGSASKRPSSARPWPGGTTSTALGFTREQSSEEPGRGLGVQQHSDDSQQEANVEPCSDIEDDEMHGRLHQMLLGMHGEVPPVAMSVILEESRDDLLLGHHGSGSVDTPASAAAVAEGKQEQG